MPTTAAAPPRPVSPAPHWVARSPFSVGELADGFGAGWPPPKRLRVPARRRDLKSRRAEFARLVDPDHAFDMVFHGAFHLRASSASAQTPEATEMMKLYPASETPHSVHGA